MLTFLFAVLPQPIDLDAIDLQRARATSGRIVVATFIVAKPIDAYPRRSPKPRSRFRAIQRFPPAPRGSVPDPAASRSTRRT